MLSAPQADSCVSVCECICNSVLVVHAYSLTVVVDESQMFFSENCKGRTLGRTENFKPESPLPIFLFKRKMKHHL